VHDLEIDQPRTVRLLVINHVGHRRIGVRPRRAKFIAPKLMSAAIFAAGRFEHALVQRPLFHVVPKTLPRQLIQADRACVRHRRVKTIAVQHLETAGFPASPLPHIAQETNRYVRQTKIKIYQIGGALTVNISLLDHDGPAASQLLRD